MDLGERKKALHQEIKTTAVALDEGCTKEAGLEVFSHVAGLSEYERAGTLFCFVGINGEIDTASILEDASGKGKRVGVPKCTTRGIVEVREIRSLGDLKAGKYGVLEPDAEAPVMQPKEINLAIVPCISCSHDGRHLGYGDGYYDHYLVRTRAMKAIICRERIIRADTLMEPHDQLMDTVVSEHGVRRLGSR